jgi:hypothetical protein
MSSDRVGAIQDLKMLHDVLWRSHAVLMTISLLAIVSGIVISLACKKKRWRYQTHRKLGITAGISGVTALVLGVVMVQLSGGFHLVSPHAWAGTISGVLLIATPVMGLQIAKVKKKLLVRRVHRISGYVTAASMMFTVVLGLRYVGILPF